MVRFVTSILTGALAAGVAGAGSIDFRGFGTLGLARSSDGQAHYVRDLSQPDGSAGQWSADVDSVLGVQAAYRPNESIEAVIQGVSRHRFDSSYRPEVNWAFVKFHPDADFNVRVGRLGTEFYMLGDSRLVGYASLAVRPPGDFFGTLPFYHFDGFDLLVSHELDDGILRGKLFHGTSHESLALADRVWVLDGSRFSGAYLDYLRGAWQVRASYAQIRYSSDPLPDLLQTLDSFGLNAVSNDLRMAGQLSRFHSLGAVYDDGPWHVEAMLSRIQQSSLSYENGHSGYVQVGRRIGAFTPYATLSRWKTDSKALPAGLPPPLATAISLVMADGHSDQRTASLGVRWDFRDGMDVKLQWDRVRGSADSIFPYRKETPAWDGRTDVLSLTLDFVF